MRDREVAGLRFRERKIVGPYTVDFICPAAKLVLLIDGTEPHDPAQATWLRDNGYRLLTFRESEVLNDPQTVVDAIARSFELRIVKG